MVEVRSRQDYVIEGPGEITTDNVQYWCRHAKDLERSQRDKATDFVKYDCVRYVGDDEEFSSKCTFVCLPLNTKDNAVLRNTARVFAKMPFPKDYNNSVYKIFLNSQGFWECSCQGWKALDGVNPDGCNCSHILALFYCFKMKRFNRQHGATELLMRPEHTNYHEEEECEA